MASVSTFALSKGATKPSSCVNLRILFRYLFNGFATLLDVLSNAGNRIAASQEEGQDSHVQSNCLHDFASLDQIAHVGEMPGDGGGGGH
jgi:hypothetical protein